MDDALLATHARQIRALAHSLRWQCRHGLTVADLEQVGWIAVLQCQQRLDVARGCLKIYAERRIWGAMHDALRQWDWRSVYAQRQGMPPIDVVPLEEAQHPHITYTWEPWLAARVAQLPARLQQLVYLYYGEDWNMREIAAALGLTVGSVSQLHKKALGLLRRRLIEGEACLRKCTARHRGKTCCQRRNGDRSGC